MSQNAVPYWHVDAFASRPFAGNQAAVMLLEGWPDDAVLQAVAEENQFAETAFLVSDATGAADFELRWFTPTVEVALCGHATLASGHVLLTQDPAKAGAKFRTRKSGILAVDRAAHGYSLSLPVIVMDGPAADRLTVGLGAAPLEAFCNDAGYGIFLYADEAAIHALAPDMRALAAHGNFQFICTAPGEQTDVVSRVFVPGGGVDEDSVTGSAHAALTPFWASRLGRSSFTAHQASARGGTLHCTLAEDRAVLGGDCVTVVEGRFNLPR